MKKLTKIIIMLIAVITVPALAGLGITALWNKIITAICGFASITFWQSVGLFLLGQLLSGGFLIMLFILSGCIHAIRHNHADWHRHWHKMTDKERREFILSRRDRFEFRNHPHKKEDAAQ